MMERNVNVVKDLYGKELVVINDVYFMGKQNINWNDVEKYLRRYVKDFFLARDSEDLIYIGTNLPDEYSSSKYTRNSRND